MKLNKFGAFAEMVQLVLAHYLLLKSARLYIAYRKISCRSRICDSFQIHNLAKNLACKGGAAFIRVFAITIQQNVGKSRMTKIPVHQQLLYDM